MHDFTRVTVLVDFALKCKEVFRTGFISLFISHLFVHCVLFGIYCFALHPEHLGQHAGILGHQFSLLSWALSLAGEQESPASSCMAWTIVLQACLHLLPQYQNPHIRILLLQGIPLVLLRTWILLPKLTACPALGRSACVDFVWIQRVPLLKQRFYVLYVVWGMFSWGWFGCPVKAQLSSCVQLCPAHSRTSESRPAHLERSSPPPLCCVLSVCLQWVQPASLSTPENPKIEFQQQQQSSVLGEELGSAKCQTCHLLGAGTAQPSPAAAPGTPGTPLCHPGASLVLVGF